MADSLVTVEITGTGGGGYERTVKVAAPSDDAISDKGGWRMLDWWGDNVLPLTGSGRGGFDSVTAKITEASDPRLINHTHVWEG